MCAASLVGCGYGNVVAAGGRNSDRNPHSSSKAHTANFLLRTTRRASIMSRVLAEPVPVVRPSQGGAELGARLNSSEKEAPLSTSRTHRATARVKVGSPVRAAAPRTVHDDELFAPSLHLLAPRSSPESRRPWCSYASTDHTSSSCQWSSAACSAASEFGACSTRRTSRPPAHSERARASRVQSG